MPYGHQTGDGCGRGGGGRGGGGGGGRGGGGGGGGGGRNSLLEPAILVALATEESHGYDLRASVDDLTCGFVNVDPGGLYRVLRRMEDDGLVVSAWMDGEHGPQRRTYRVTDDGREALGAWADRLAERSRAIDNLTQAIHRLEPEQSSSRPPAATEHTTNKENDDAAR